MAVISGGLRPALDVRHIEYIEYSPSFETTTTTTRRSMYMCTYVCLSSNKTVKTRLQMPSLCGKKRTQTTACESLYKNNPTPLVKPKISRYGTQKHSI